MNAPLSFLAVAASQSAVFPAHVEALRASAILHEAALAAGISSVSADLVQAGFNPATGAGAKIFGDALHLPYYQIDGAPLIGRDGLAVARVRVFDARTPAERAGGFEQRFIGRRGAGSFPYIPRQLPALMMTGTDYLVIVDDEIKALAGCANGIPTIAIPGAERWTDAGNDAAGNPVLLDVVRRFEAVVIAADADINQRLNARDALQALAVAIQTQTGITSAYMIVPEGPKPKKKKADAMAEVDGDETPAAFGFDAWIAHAPSIDVVSDRLRWHIKKQRENAARLKTGGYRSLGITPEGLLCVWNEGMATAALLKDGEASSPAVLMKLADPDWIDARYGEIDKRGKTRVDYQDVTKDLIRGCRARGIFRLDKICGRGVWPDPKNPNALVVNSDDVWRTDGTPMERISSERGDSVYPALGTIGIAPDTLGATVNEIAQLKDALESWKFTRDSDPALVLGWILLAMLSSGLPWRPHLSLTGSAGSGKSGLVDLVRAVIGDAGAYFTGGTTEPGVRQSLQQDGLAVLIDENEANQKAMNTLLGMLRVASSGGRKSMGTSDQKGVTYNVRSIGMLAGVVPPLFEPADDSRFLIVQIQEAKKGEAKPLLLDNLNAARALGKKIFARMLSSYPRLRRAQDMLRDAIAERVRHSRFSDSMSPCIAAAWVGLNDHELTADEARAFLATFDIEDDITRMTETTDEKMAFEHMMLSCAKVENGGRTEIKTIANVCAWAYASSKGPHQDALGICGLRVVHEEDGSPTLLINPNSPGFKNLFKETKFAGGNIAMVLGRLNREQPKTLPSAERLRRGSTYIGGMICKPLAIHIELEKVDTSTTE